MTRKTLTFLLFALVLAVLGFGVRAAFAQPAKTGPRGHIGLTVANQGTGPLELAPKDGGFLGEFVITNRAADPLTVSRVAIRGDDDDVRAPARLSARFVEGGGTTMTIPPNASKKVQVIWLPEKDPRMKQVFAHVVVT